METPLDSNYDISDAQDLLIEQTEIETLSKLEDLHVSLQTDESLEQENISIPIIHKPVNNLEVYAITYFAGYLVHKVMHRYMCGLCKTYLCKNDENDLDGNELLIALRDFGIDKSINHLKRPTYTVVQIDTTTL